MELIIAEKQKTRQVQMGVSGQASVHLLLANGFSMN